MTIRQDQLSWTVGIDARGGHWLHLTLRGVQVGSVTLRPSDTAGELWLSDLEVKEHRRGRIAEAWQALLAEAGLGSSIRRQGLGTRLLLAAIELARQEGATQVRLYLTGRQVRRRWLIAWFEKHGFVEAFGRWDRSASRTFVQVP